MPESDDEESFRPGAKEAPTRTDTRRDSPTAFSPTEQAPVFRDGFYVVPKVGGLGDDA